MSRIIEPVIGEFKQEAATTKRVLERVPADKLSWKPHPKSMSLGQLAKHVATIPGDIAKLAQPDEFDVSGANFNFPAPTNTAEILAALDASVKAAGDYLGGLDDAAATRMWSMKSGEKVIFSMPRIAMIRMIMLDVPVPSIYGPSADENPFA
jgi:uncharacterized damage-inducible protein DinB